MNATTNVKRQPNNPKPSPATTHVGFLAATAEEVRIRYGIADVRLEHVHLQSGRRFVRHLDAVLQDGYRELKRREKGGTLIKTSHFVALYLQQHMRVGAIKHCSFSN